MYRLLEVLLVLSGLTMFIGASCLSCTSHIPRQLVVPSVVDTTQYHDGVVRLETLKGEISISNFKGKIATGFAVDEHHIMTAGHFCEELSTLQRIKLIKKEILAIGARQDGSLYEVGKGTVVASSPNSPDLCVIKFANHGLIPFPLAVNTNLVQTEDKVTVIGAPAGFFPVRRSGYVIARKAGDDFVSRLEDKLLLAIDIQSGSSGSPVIWDGKIIGVVIVLPRGLHASAMAEPIEELHEFLDKYVR